MTPDSRTSEPARKYKIALDSTILKANERLIESNLLKGALVYDPRVPGEPELADLVEILGTRKLDNNNFEVYPGRNGGAYTILPEEIPYIKDAFKNWGGLLDYIADPENDEFSEGQHGRHIDKLIETYKKCDEGLIDLTDVHYDTYNYLVYALEIPVLAAFLQKNYLRHDDLVSLPLLKIARSEDSQMISLNDLIDIIFRVECNRLFETEPNPAFSQTS